MPSTVADYLVARLAELGVRHVFSVPGDYVFGFLDSLDASARIERIGTSNELVAGYAADGYARLNGVGAVAVTYGVGAFSVLNAVAGSYVERLPVIVIVGSPSNQQRLIAQTKGVVYHHTTGDMSADLSVFTHVTAHAVVLRDARAAPAAIDVALGVAMTERRPVYLEVASDLWTAARDAPSGPLSPPTTTSESAALEEAVSDAWARLCSARNPLILGGILIERLGLQQQFHALAAASGFPFTVTLTGKTFVSEESSRFIGVYDGARDAHVQGVVDAADCVLAAGILVTDHNSDLVQRHYGTMVFAGVNHLRIGYHSYAGVELKDVLPALTTKFLNDTRYPLNSGLTASAPLPPAATAPASPVTYEVFFERLAAFLDDSMVVLADLSISLHVSARLRIRRPSGFVAQAAWDAIGYVMGAAVGVGFAAPDCRPVVIVGDGGFQMTCQAISTMVRHGQRPIIFVMNNGIYGLEQANIDLRFFSGEAPLTAYNRLDAWDYAKLAQAFGAWAVTVSTRGDLEAALSQAHSQEGPSLVHVRLPETDLPSQLVQLTPAIQ